MRPVEVREGTSSTHPLCPVSLSRARSLLWLSCVFLLACPSGPQFTSFISTTGQIRTPQKPPSPLPNLEFVHKHTLPTHPHTHTTHVLWPVDIFPNGLGSLVVTGPTRKCHAYRTHPEQTQKDNKPLSLLYSSWGCYSMSLADKQTTQPAIICCVLELLSFGLLLWLTK